MNVKKKDLKLPIVAELTKLMKALDKHVPNIRFVCKESTRGYDEGSFTEYYEHADCFIEYEYQGTIYYGRYQKRKPNTKYSGTKVPLYSVKSALIENRRRPRNRKESFNMRPVLKECVRIFQPTPSEEIARSVARSIESSFDALLDRHKQNTTWDSLMRKANDNYLKDYKQSVVNYVAFGNDLTDIRTCFSEEAKDNFQKAFKSQEIVQDLHSEMGGGAGFFVCEESDGTYEVVHLRRPEDLACSTKDFDELPEAVRTKLVALKIANFQEAVQNLGVNLSTSDTRGYYYISENNLDDLV